MPDARSVAQPTVSGTEGIRSSADADKPAWRV